MRADARPRFSSLYQDWRTPKALYETLNAEFRFTLDPCPPAGEEFVLQEDGLHRSWRFERVFLNPPYDNIPPWVGKAASRDHDTVVALLPARTGTAWFHDYVLPSAIEIRFLRGRLKFEGHANRNAPFDSMVVVW